MGHFYTNFTAPGVDSEKMLAAARELRRRAYVIQSGAAGTVVFDQACDDQDVSEIETLGQALSERLNGPVIGCLNHDDDHLLLWVFRGKKKVGFYQSCVDAPRFAWSLSRVRGGLLAYPLIGLVLGWPFVLFQFLRHKALVKLLSLPACAVGYGFTYLARDEVPDGCSKVDIKEA